MTPPLYGLILLYLSVWAMFLGIAYLVDLTVGATVALVYALTLCGWVHAVWYDR